MPACSTSRDAIGAPLRSTPKTAFDAAPQSTVPKNTNLAAAACGAICLSPRGPAADPDDCACRRFARRTWPWGSTKPASRRSCADLVAGKRRPAQAPCTRQQSANEDNGNAHRQVVSPSWYALRKAAKSAGAEQSCTHGPST